MDSTQELCVLHKYYLELCVLHKYYLELCVLHKYYLRESFWRKILNKAWKQKVEKSIKKNITGNKILGFEFLEFFFKVLLL